MRPTYLLVEPTHEGLSARKLVLETVLKRNVLLANTADEAQTTLHVFPNVDGVVVHGEVADSSALVRWIKQEYPEKFVVFLAEPMKRACKGANTVISGHDPIELLAALDVQYRSSGAAGRRSALLDDLVRTLRKGQPEITRILRLNILAGAPEREKQPNRRAR